jgi:hypothetical protein
MLAPFQDAKPKPRRRSAESGARAAPLFHATERPQMMRCTQCGQPTIGELCAFCRLRGEVARKSGRRRDREEAIAARASARAGELAAGEMTAGETAANETGGDGA